LAFIKLKYQKQYSISKKKKRVTKLKNEMKGCIHYIKII